MILHGPAPPLARLRLDDSALVYVQIEALVRVRRIVLHRRPAAASAALRPVALADSEALFRADRLHFPRARELVGPGALHGHMRAGNRADDVVFALDLVDVRALAHP